MKIVVVIAGLVVVVAATIYPIFSGSYFSTGDTQDVFIPLETFFQREQRAGRLPAWDPNIAWGYPVIASGQIGFFYPPLLLARFTPVWFYFPALLFGHLVAAAVGSYLLLRRQQSSQLAAVLAGITFATSQFLFQHLTHFNIILTATWLPWQLLAAYWAAHSQSLTRRHVGIFALVLGLPFLAGHIQFPLLTASVAALYFMQQRGLRRSWQATTMIVVVITCLTFGIAAAQLLPTAELLTQSNRVSNGDFDVEVANQYSFPIYHLPTVVFPHFFATGAGYWGKRLSLEYGIFIGTIPLLLIAMASWPRHQQLSSRPHYSFFIFLGAIAWLLSLGNLSPVRLLGIEPSLWIFSAPARWLLFTTMAGAVLAGHGLDAIAHNLADWRRVLKVVLIVVSVGVILANSIGWLLVHMPTAEIYAQITQIVPSAVVGREPTYYLNKIDGLKQSLIVSSVSLRSPFTYLPLLVIVVSLVGLRRASYSRWLVGAASIELIIIAATTNTAVPWSTTLQPPAIINELPTSVIAHQARTLSIRQPDTNTGKILSNPSNVSIQENQVYKHELLLPLTNAQFDIPGVEWPASLLQPAHNEVLSTLRENPSPEAAYLAAAKRNIGAIIRQTTTNEITVTSINSEPRAQLVNQPTIPVVYTSISPTQTRLTFEAPVADTLLIRDNWYPGWVAYIDNNPAPITVHDDIFRAVAVPAGQHAVNLEYQPRPLYVGLTLTVVALAISLALVLWPRRKII